MAEKGLRQVATAQWDFERLRENDDYVYVDKTDMLAKLASKEKDALYFIARPRRFGKSLMLTTLKCLFEGKRRLFRGLKVEESGWDWSKTYPVVMLNMSEVCGETPEEIKEGLRDLAGDVASQFGLAVRPVPSPGRFFGNVLKALAAKHGRFVVLVDEYDVPLQGFLGDRAAIRRVRKIMHDFYVQFKNNVGAIRFLMITGVTKLAKLSVFSGLNNPTDLTIRYGEYAALLGYTHDELRKYFSGHVAALGARLGKTPEETYGGILRWYDSYRFSPYSEARVVNPVALGEAFNAGELASYWSATGMPTLVLERMQSCDRRPDQLEDIPASLEDLDVCDAMTMPMVPLLYQSGYLTIRNVDWEVDDAGARIPHLRLGVPNREIAHALSGLWWKTLVQMDEGDFRALVRVAARQIAEGNVRDLVCETLYQLYAKLPPTWSPRREADAKRYFLLFMEMAGARMQPEKPSALGFADAVVETPGGVWVMEFKFNRSAASAVRQIRERGYADAWRGGRRPVTLVGIRFDSARRNIGVPLFEPLRAGGESGTESAKSFKTKKGKRK